MRGQKRLSQSVIKFKSTVEDFISLERYAGFDLQLAAERMSVRLVNILDDDNPFPYSLCRPQIPRKIDICTADLSNGIGLELKPKGKHILHYVSIDPRVVVFRSVPGIERAIDDGESLRVVMTTGALFSRERLPFQRWRSTTVFKLITEHLKPLVGANEFCSFWGIDKDFATRSDTSVSIENAIRYYRNMAGAHNTPNIAQVHGYKLPSGRWFVPPALEGRGQTLVKRVFPLRPVWKYWTCVIIMVSMHVYSTIVNRRAGYSVFADFTKDANEGIDRTILVGARAKAATTPPVISRTDRIVPIVDLRGLDMNDCRPHLSWVGELDPTMLDSPLPPNLAEAILADGGEAILKWFRPADSEDAP